MANQNEVESPSSVVDSEEHFISVTNVNNPSQVEGKWYLLRVTISHKREFVYRQILMFRERDKLQDLIMSIERPTEAVYQELILLELSDYKAARIKIQPIEYIKRLEPQPLKIEQVNRMLGK
jgi:hypothetical protein